MILEAIRRGYGFVIGSRGRHSPFQSTPTCQFCQPAHKLVPVVLPNNQKDGWRCPHCDAKYVVSTGTTSSQVEPWDPNDQECRDGFSPFGGGVGHQQRWRMGGLVFQSDNHHHHHQQQHPFTNDENTPINPRPTQRTCIELEAGRMVFDGNVLCRTCSHHQTLIVQLLAAYEQDHLNEARTYRADLDKRYPLCPTCEARVKQRLDQVAYKLQTRRLASARSMASSLKTDKSIISAGGSWRRTVLVWESIVQVSLMTIFYNGLFGIYRNVGISECIVGLSLSMLTSILIVGPLLSNLLGLLLLYAGRIMSIYLFMTYYYQEESFNRNNVFALGIIGFSAALLFILGRGGRVKGGSTLKLFHKPNTEYQADSTQQRILAPVKTSTGIRSPFSPPPPAQPPTKPPPIPIHLRPTAFDVSRPTGIEKVLESFSIGGDDDEPITNQVYRNRATFQQQQQQQRKSLHQGSIMASVRWLYRVFPQVLLTGTLLAGRVSIEEWSWEAMILSRPSSGLLVSAIIIFATCLGTRGFLWPRLVGSTLRLIITILTVLRLASFAVTALTQQNTNAQFPFLESIPNLVWFLIDVIVISSR